MSDHLSRRDFLKLMTVGSAAAAVLSGCGTAARYVEREPYTNMPEYTLPGRPTYYATTCRECPAGCGIIVKTIEGRAKKIEGNPDHPVSQGGSCSRGQAAVQGLYNPDRIIEPLIQKQRGTDSYGPINWDTAVAAVRQALAESNPQEIAFLMGMAPDHLYDLAHQVTQALGAPAPLRYSALSLFEGRATLMQAVRQVYGSDYLPTFDFGNADVVFSFGANFAETWFSPTAYQRAYSNLRRERRGYLVHFEPRMSLSAASADKWFPIAPGSEGQVALAIGKLAAELTGQEAPAFAGADVVAIARDAGISEEDLHRLAEMYAFAGRKVALPGGVALGHSNGLQNAQAILSLNVLANNLNQEGGVKFLLTPALGEEASVSSMAEIAALVERMKAGQVKALLIHAVNPLFDLPAALGFAEALKNVPMVISFASFADETSRQADYLLPDHTGLESWGYQKSTVGGQQAALSALQPVVVPLYDTRATADVLLAAVQAIGGDLAAKIPYTDEVQFLQAQVSALADRGVAFTAGASERTFWAQWLQNGGWWGVPLASSLAAPTLPEDPLAVPPADFESSRGYFLLPFAHPHLGDGSGANRPWLQETPDPMTTVMWGSWVEINPKTADELGLHDHDVVKIISAAGEIEVPVYRFPAIRPDTVAIPFGNGHTALGRYAAGVGANPMQVLGLPQNEAGDLAYAATRVQIVPTGKTFKLARFEDRIGVYERRGEH
ncbi:MAG: molybdopterin-dependent oxidoreductase [Chloroflexota bacterium]